MEQTLEKVTLPLTSEETDESLIVLWYKSVGDAVKEGEALVEIQTEKATAEVAAPASGVLKEILVDRGETATVGDVLGIISQDAEGSEEKAPQNNEKHSSKTNKTNSFVPASPRIRRLAKKLDVDLQTVDGTGPDGKLTEEDVRAAAEANRQLSEEVSPIRRTIARKMMDSLHGSAQLTETAWADVTKLSENRKQWCSEAGWTDWILRAAILSLQEYPLLNATWRETEIEIHDHIHLGVAVDTEKGLLVPVINEAEKFSLPELHDAVEEAISKARNGEEQDLKGSTFTVTSLSGFGIQFFTPILNPPEAAILGIGQIEPQLVLENGHPVERQRLPLSLTFDHRMIDGAPAARFFQSLIQRLEDPEKKLR